MQLPKNDNSFKKLKERYSQHDVCSYSTGRDGNDWMMMFTSQGNKRLWKAPQEVRITSDHFGFLNVHPKHSTRSFLQSPPLLTCAGGSLPCGRALSSMQTMCSAHLGCCPQYVFTFRRRRLSPRYGGVKQLVWVGCCNCNLFARERVRTRWRASQSREIRSLAHERLQACRHEQKK